MPRFSTRRKSPNLPVVGAYGRRSGQQALVDQEPLLNLSSYRPEIDHHAPRYSKQTPKLQLPNLPSGVYAF